MRLEWDALFPSLRCSAQTASRPSGVPARSRLSLRPCRPRLVGGWIDPAGRRAFPGGAVIARWTPRSALRSALLRAVETGGG